jgi:drug/metabolite transporter (DMT)-like permease
MSSSNSHLSRGDVIALASAVVLSTTAIFIRYLTQNYHLPPLVLAFWRDVFVVLTLLLIIGLLRPFMLRVKRHHLLYLAGYGLVLALFNALWTFSVALNGAAVATVLNYCSAVFTAILGWWLLKERLDGAKFAAIAICLTGCVLVAEAYDWAVWHTNLFGILTGILAGLGYALYSLMGRSAFQRGMNPWTTLLYTFGFATGFLLLFNLIPGNPLPGAAVQPLDLFWLGDAWVGWGALIILGAGPTVAGYGLYNVSLSHLPASIVNLIVTLEPVFTAAIAYSFLGERLSGAQIIGSVMIIGGVILLRVCEDWLATTKKSPALVSDP